MWEIPCRLLKSAPFSYLSSIQFCSLRFSHKFGPTALPTPSSLTMTTTALMQRKYVSNHRKTHSHTDIIAGEIREGRHEGRQADNRAAAGKPSQSTRKHLMQFEHQCASLYNMIEGYWLAWYKVASMHIFLFVTSFYLFVWNSLNNNCYRIHSNSENVVVGFGRHSFIVYFVALIFYFFYFLNQWSSLTI